MYNDTVAAGEVLYDLRPRRAGVHAARVSFQNDLRSLRRRRIGRIQLGFEYILRMRI